MRQMKAYTVHVFVWRYSTNMLDYDGMPIIYSCCSQASLNVLDRTLILFTKYIAMNSHSVKIISCECVCGKQIRKRA